MNLYRVGACCGLTKRAGNISLLKLLGLGAGVPIGTGIVGERMVDPESAAIYQRSLAGKLTAIGRLPKELYRGIMVE
jgi:hypothetical protein